MENPYTPKTAKEQDAILKNVNLFDSQGQKDNSGVPSENYLEPRSKAEEEILMGQTAVDADTHSDNSHPYDKKQEENTFEKQPSFKANSSPASSNSNEWEENMKKFYDKYPKYKALKDKWQREDIMINRRVKEKLK